MSTKPMQTPRRRAPAFPADVPSPVSPASVSTPPTPPSAPPLAPGTAPGGAREQFNFRAYASELAHLRRVQNQLREDGVKTDLTEMMHAVLFATRYSPEEMRGHLRRWREAIDPI